MRESGYLHGRPGWAVHHHVPLCHGGRDEPHNMEWLPVNLITSTEQ